MIIVITINFILTARQYDNEKLSYFSFYTVEHIFITFCEKVTHVLFFTLFITIKVVLLSNQKAHCKIGKRGHKRCHWEIAFEKVANKVKRSMKAISL